MINRPIIVGLSLLAASSLMANPEGVPPGPPAVEIAGTVDTNVVNTVDTNVINTVNANLVNTISGETLNGVRFGPSRARGVGIFFLNPAKLHAMSVSIASASPGEICNVVVLMGSEPGDTSLQPTGLSVLSNGQANTVSATYGIPIAPVSILNFEVDGTVDGACDLSLSLSYEDVEVEADFARLAAGEQRVRIEVE